MGRILVGTASWTDSSLIGSGWYPSGVTSAEERLAYYASRFPLVEVDSTYYFLPRREVAKRWAERTPAGFTFNVKAFSLLTQHPTRPEALPPGLRPGGKRRVYLRHLTSSDVDEIWSRFLSALGPLEKAGKLGAVLFQFPPWFTIKRANKDYLVECAERARRVRICVEFRNPTWLSGENRAETMELLATHGLAYVCVDTARRKGSVPAVLPSSRPCFTPVPNFTPSPTSGAGGRRRSALPSISEGRPPSTAESAPLPAVTGSTTCRTITLIRWPMAG